MQLSMFAHEPKSQRKADYSFSLYNWSKKLREASGATMQGDFVSDVMPASHVVTYKSGSSAKTDLMGYMAAGANIGICATDASKPVLSLLASYVSNGGRAFIDSGAFRNFKAKLKKPDTPPVDFDVVFSRYEYVLAQCTSSNGLIVVAPDIVGKQAASYALLEAYKDRITALHARGASIMVPLQKGEDSLLAHYNRCKALLGFDFICGLPSNAKAISRDEVMSFMNAEPSCVHFLGTAESSLVHEAKFRSPRTQFSCDATLIRKHIVDILPALKNRDSSFETAMSRRSNVPGSIDITVMFSTAIATRPLPHSQTNSTFRTAGGYCPTARTGLG